ncbi:MAG: hypothetical protein WCZ00_02475 [Acholeplasmataceae bacterium]|jgi:hypothetical protein
MKDKRYLFLITVIIMSVVFILVYTQLPYKRIPNGLPADYFDIIDKIEDTNANVYVYSDKLNFNDDFHPKFISKVSEIELNRFNEKNFLVIDMDKYNSKSLGTIEEIDQIYKNQCFYILLINYGSSDSTKFDELLTDNSKSSDLITLTYSACHSSYHIEYFSSGFSSNDILMYAILDKISMLISAA